MLNFDRGQNGVGPAKITVQAEATITFNPAGQNGYNNADQEIEQTFKLADKAGDNCELNRSANLGQPEGQDKNLNSVKLSDAQTALRLADANGDGGADRQELARASHQLLSNPNATDKEKKLGELFSSFVLGGQDGEGLLPDTDGDGKLSEDELSEFAGSDGKSKTITPKDFKKTFGSQYRPGGSEVNLDDLANIADGNEVGSADSRDEGDYNPGNVNNNRNDDSGKTNPKNNHRYGAHDGAKSSDAKSSDKNAGDKNPISQLLKSLTKLLQALSGQVSNDETDGDDEDTVNHNDNGGYGTNNAGQSAKSGKASQTAKSQKVNHDKAADSAKNQKKTSNASQDSAEEGDISDNGGGDDLKQGIFKLLGSFLKVLTQILPSLLGDGNSQGDTGTNNNNNYQKITKF